MLDFYSISFSKKTPLWPPTFMRYYLSTRFKLLMRRRKNMNVYVFAAAMAMKNITTPANKPHRRYLYLTSRKLPTETSHRPECCDHQSIGQNDELEGEKRKTRLLCLRTSNYRFVISWSKSFWHCRGRGNQYVESVWSVPNTSPAFPPCVIDVSWHQRNCFLWPILVDFGWST